MVLRGGRLIASEISSPGMLVVPVPMCVLQSDKAEYVVFTSILWRPMLDLRFSVNAGEGSYALIGETDEKMNGRILGMFLVCNECLPDHWTRVASLPFLKGSGLRLTVPIFDIGSKFGLRAYPYLRCLPIFMLNLTCHVREVLERG